MALRFATGGGRVDLGPVARAPLANDFGRRFVSFSLIGAASTAVSLALFLATHDAIGPIAANVVAVTATFVANAWANARYTERRSRPRWARPFALYAGSIATTSAALALVGAVTTSLAVQVAVLVATWSLAAVARFIVIGRRAMIAVRTIDRAAGSRRSSCPAASSSRSARPCSAPRSSWRWRWVRACRPGRPT